MGTYTEKEVLADALATQKCATNLFNMSANECVHSDIRATMLEILSDEHNLQQDVFDMMHEKGYYPTPAADAKKIQELKTQHANEA